MLWHGRLFGEPLVKCTFFCERGSISLLGVEYLVSVLRNTGYEVDVVFDRIAFQPWKTSSVVTDCDSQVIADITNTGCDLVLAYINTTSFKRVVHLFSQMKQAAPGLLTCVGGPHASYAHEYAIRKDCIDYLCRGEGEIALIQLIDMLEGRQQNLPLGIYRMVDGKIEGEGFGTLVADLDSLPYPDKSDYYANVPANRDHYMIITGRGCYNKCTFCNSHTMMSYYREDGFNFMRRRSVDDVIEELKHAKKIYKPKFVWFCDDTFVYNKKWLREFAARYSAEVNIPFGCSTIPDFFDEELLVLLFKSGLTSVEVGIQTLNPETRLRVFGRRETNDQFSRFVTLLRRIGVYVHTDHILNPWDSRESLVEQIKAYSAIRPSFINVFHLQYFPTTSIIDSALADGLLTPAAAEEIGEGSSDTYFSGGSFRAFFDDQKDLALLILLSPFIPRRLMTRIVDSRHVRWLSKIPSSIVLPLRAINAVLRKSDMFGRTHLRNVILALLKWPLPPDPAKVAGLRALALAKGPRTLLPAAHLASGRAAPIEAE